jgi:hypothetical protein
VPPAAGVMLKQEELALLMAISSVQGNPALLRELRKALAAKNTAKAAACTKAKTSCMALSKRHATITGARSVPPLSPRKGPQPATGKRKAESSGSDGLTTPAARRPAPDPPGTSGAPTPSCSRQQGDTAGKPAYAALVAGSANPHQPSGQPKPIATGSDSSKPAASFYAAQRRMSVDMSGPLSSMPAGTTEAGAVLAGERPNKTPVFVTGVTDTRGFLVWLRTLCPSSLSAQMKSEKLIIVPGTADGFRVTVSALRSLDRSKGVTFHTFFHPEDRCVRLLVKILGRQMPESVVREELVARGIRVQGVMQLRSGRRDQDATRDRPPTPHFVVSMARGPEVQRPDPVGGNCHTYYVG